MLVKIYTPFAGWRMVPAHEEERIHGYVVEVSDETAARWQAVLEQYRTVQLEMQAVADASGSFLKNGGHSHGA
jgi:hypothetical protein